MGGLKMKDAQSVADAAQKRYDKSVSLTQTRLDESNERIQEYGRQQEEARRLVVKRMIAFLERQRRQVKPGTAQLLDGIEAEHGDIGAFDGPLTADVNWLMGAGMAALTGAGTSAAIPGAVTVLGAASTGTAISSLSGAAAHNATMAWLGGGALSAGGGGVAAGTAALGVVTVGPTLLIGGLTLNSQGDKAMHKAKEHEAKVAVAVEEQAAFRTFLNTFDIRITEVSEVVAGLVQRAEGALDSLEQLDFDPAQHTAAFDRAMALALAVKDLTAVPVIDDDGQINSEMLRLIPTYKELT
jgi:hypothetical protein